MEEVPAATYKDEMIFSLWINRVLSTIECILMTVFWFKQLNTKGCTHKLLAYSTWLIMPAIVVIINIVLMLGFSLSFLNVLFFHIILTKSFHFLLGFIALNSQNLFDDDWLKGKFKDYKNKYD